MSPKSNRASLLAPPCAFASGALFTAETADTIYTGDHIIAINDTAPSAEALTVDPMTIKDIKVVETIKEGKIVFAAK